MEEVFFWTKRAFWSSRYKKLMVKPELTSKTDPFRN